MWCGGSISNASSAVRTTTKVYFRGCHWPSYSCERIRRSAATPTSRRNAESCRSSRRVAWPSFVCRSHPTGCFAHVQMFLTEDWAARSYTINLAADPGGAAGAAGHISRYCPDGPRGRFSGEAERLRTTRATFVPPLPSPAVASADE